MVLGTVGSRVCARLPRLVCALWLIGAACSRSSLSAAAPSTHEKESVSAVLDQAEVHGVSLQILAKENGCVLGSGSRVRLSKAIHQGGVYCKQRGVDQKEFWSFAHDPE